MPGRYDLCQNPSIPVKQMVYLDMLTFLLAIILARLSPEQDKYKMCFGKVCLTLPTPKGLPSNPHCYKDCKYVFSLGTESNGNR